MENLIDRINKLELKVQMIDAELCSLKVLKTKEDKDKTFRANYYKNKYVTDSNYRDRLREASKRYYHKKKELRQAVLENIIEKAKVDEPVIESN